MTKRVRSGHGFDPHHPHTPFHLSPLLPPLHRPAWQGVARGCEVALCTTWAAWASRKQVGLGMAGGPPVCMGTRPHASGQQRSLIQGLLCCHNRPRLNRAASWWLGVQMGTHTWGRPGLRVQGWVHGQVQATPVIFVLVIMEHTD